MGSHQAPNMKQEEKKIERKHSECSTYTIHSFSLELGEVKHCLRQGIDPNSLLIWFVPIHETAQSTPDRTWSVSPSSLPQNKLRCNN